MRNTIIYYLLFSVLFSCEKQIDFPVVISLPEPVENENAFKRLSDDLDSLNFKRRGVDITENNIVIMDYRKGALRRFDKEGNYLNTIARRGLGIHDFYSYISHSIDEKNNLVYIMLGNNVKSFNLEGKFVQEYSVTDPFYPQYGFADDLIITPDGQFLLHISNLSGGAKQDFIKAKNGVVYSQHENNLHFTSKRKINYNRKLGMAYFKADSMILVKDYGDTVFALKNNRFIPRYIMKELSKASGPSSYTQEEFDKLLRYRNLFENDRYFYFYAVDSVYDYAGRYDKIKEKVEFYKKKTETLLDEKHYDPYILSLLDKVPDDLPDREKKNPSAYPQYIYETINGYRFKMIGIGNGVYLGETEVTQNLWKALFGEYYPYSRSSGEEPVTNVSWLNAQGVSVYLSNKSGKLFRLPTQKEWEYAAGVENGSEGPTIAGIGNIEEYANFGSERPLPVKTLKPNDKGFYDLYGNVSEWCMDWSSGFKPEINNYMGLYTGPYKITVGGSYANNADDTEVSFFKSLPPNVANGTNGFRLALQL